MHYRGWVYPQKSGRGRFWQNGYGQFLEVRRFKILSNRFKADEEKKVLKGVRDDDRDILGGVQDEIDASVRIDQGGTGEVVDMFYYEVLEVPSS